MATTSGSNQQQGGYGGGFGGGYGGSNRAALYAPANGYGNGFNPMQGSFNGFGGQQMQNPFMGGQGGFGGQQMQNPFMGGQGGFRGQQMQNPFMGGQQMQNPFMGGQQMVAGMGGTAQTGYMSPGGYGNNMQGGFGGFNGQMDQGSNSFGNFGPSQQQGGFRGGYDPYQMQNPFMGGQGGFRGGYDPYQMQNPFMGGQGFGQDRGFRGNQRSGGQFGRNDFREQQGMTQDPAYMRDAEFQGYQQQQTDLSQQMNDYMQKAPMYQQLQDLQGKMQGVQNRYNTSVTPLPSPQRVRPEPVADMDKRYRDPNQGGLGGLGGLLGLANSGGLGGNRQPNLNNFTAPYRGAPQRPSYDEYFAERSRSPIQTVIPTREQYDNPVYQPTTPQYRG
jgi:hypothetical protein